MFSGLDEHDLRIVINAMEVIQYKKGDVIIK
jgi:cAMP-dependent protein kinase regulator